MKLAITISTYRRTDGRTPFYLKRALNSVFSQTHKDFKVFLIGDCYDRVEEILPVIYKYPIEKLYFENLKESIERKKYKNKNDLWCCAGVTPIKLAISKALEEGFEHICHLDHDDYWLPNHLTVINDTIELTNADWICTKSIYGPFIYPEINKQESIIPFLPLPGGCINSSTCYNHKTIPLRYRNTIEETGVAIPADSDLWERMRKYIPENNLKSFLANKLTCRHDEEGFELR